MRVISAPDRAPVTGLIVLDRPPHLASGQGRQGRLSSSDSGAQLTSTVFGGLLCPCTCPRERLIPYLLVACQCHSAHHAFCTRSSAADPFVCVMHITGVAPFIHEAGVPCCHCCSGNRLGAYKLNTCACAGSLSTVSKRPQPLAPFCKFMGMQGAMQPWEGPAVLLDGSSTYRCNLLPLA